MIESMGVDRKSKTDEPTLYTWVPPKWRLSELAVVIEVTPEALAVEVWRALARVRLWAEGDVPNEGLFSSRAMTRESMLRRDEAYAQSPEIADALRMLGPDSIVRADRNARLLACQEISAWAEERGYFKTAVQAAEAAAFCEPADPALANAAGRVCRHAGERGRAEVWYARGVGLARESQDRREYISAHLGIAAVLRDGGQHLRALRLIARAAKTAKRGGIRGKAAESFHEALSVTLLQRHFERATEFARRALETYPVRHQRLPAFVYDVAFLMVSQGLYGIALQLLTQTADKISLPHERMIVIGTLARAAGGAGSRERYKDALRKVLEAAPAFQTIAAGPMYSCALGAQLLGEWDEAKDLTRVAIASARENDLPIVLDLARQLDRDLDSRLPGTPPVDWRSPHVEALRAIAMESARKLSRWRPV